MNIKKFEAGTETEAIMLAKEELGKDAIIMNIKTIKPKGIYRFFKKPSVEITAAVDDNIIAENEKFLVKLQETKENIKINNDIIVEDKEETAYSDNDENSSLRSSAIEERLNNLQRLLEKQLNDTDESKEIENTDDKSDACIQMVYNQLINNEVNEKYASQIIAEIERTLKKDVSIDNILSSVYQKIILKIGQLKTISLEKGKQKIVYFIGPTGVGKTTTIAKIASGFKVNDDAKIALITSDTYRIAAVEQLRTYANILGVPLKVVYSPEEMKEAKEEFSEFDIILVDTAGRSHRNREQRDDIENLINAVDKSEREIYLVLSATTKYNDLVKITETYKEISDFNLIFTKLDETSCIGNIFNIKMITNAPLSYITWGQNVPDDIGNINPQSIAKQLLGGND